MLKRAIDTHINMLYKDAEAYKKNENKEAQMDCLNEIKKYVELKKQFNMAHTNQTPVIKDVKWNKTGSPQPFKRGRRADSNDVSFRLGRKTYGMTKADALSESVLLEDYGNYINIWNAYENGRILLSPELAAALKAKIEYLTN